MQDSAVLLKQVVTKPLHGLDSVRDLSITGLNDSRQKRIGQTPSSDHPLTYAFKAMGQSLKVIVCPDIAIIDHRMFQNGKALLEGTKINLAFIPLYAGSGMDDHRLRRVLVQNRQQPENVVCAGPPEPQLYGDCSL